VLSVQHKCLCVRAAQVLCVAAQVAAQVLSVAAQVAAQVLSVAA